MAPAHGRRHRAALPGGKGRGSRRARHLRELPSSEYLQLPFLDLVCFNAYLESQKRFAAYLARLQNIAGDRP